MDEVKKQLEILKAGVVEIIPEDEFLYSRFSEYMLLKFLLELGFLTFKWTGKLSWQFGTRQFT